MRKKGRMKTNGYVSAEHEAALVYAIKCNIPVFPLVPGAKTPMYAGGENGATCDPDVINKWWKQTPRAGLGAGLRFTGYFVVDVDARAGGHLWWDALLGLDESPTPLICETGSGWPSAHYWFSRTKNMKDLSIKGIPDVPGIDLKGLSSGYVILPPTVHPTTGRVYAWWDGCDPETIVPPEPPPWLEQAILRSARPVYPRRHPDGMPPFELTFPRAIQAIAEGLKIGRRVDSVRWMIECPNADSHSDKRGLGDDSSTILFAPDNPRKPGHIFCSHAHCASVR